MTHPVHQAQNYLYSIFTLRAVFVLLVCLFHFAAGVALYEECYSCVLVTHMIAQPACYGFFIISGFGITWSMHVYGYHLRHVPVFYAKRLMRLEPPFVASLALIVTVTYLLAQRDAYTGGGFHVSWKQIVLHLGYLVAFFDYKWLNPAFWTLGVEFQFYLAAAWLFPLFAHRDWRVRNGAMTVLMAVFLFTPHAKHTVNTYIPLFLMGTVMFQHRAGIGPDLERWLWLPVLVAACALYEYPGVVVGIALLCLGLLMRDGIYSRLGNALGELSYSIYLLHTIVAITLISFLMPAVTGLWGKLALIGACFAATLIAALVFHRLIEKPSQRWSQRLRYGTRASSAGQQTVITEPRT